MVLQENDISGESISVDEEVRHENDTPRLERTDEQEWQRIDESMTECWPVPFRLVVGHPLRLCNVVTHQMY